MTTSFVDTREGRFAYLAAGDEGAPVALCLHGFPDHPPSFAPVMERLAQAGYRAVAPWMRGYAPSVLEGPYHADQLADDVVAIADAVGAGDDAVLIGHDWGAIATYATLQLRPARFCRAVTMAVPHPLAFLRALRQQPAQLRRSWYMFFFQLPRVPEIVVPRGDFRLVHKLWRTWSPGYKLEENSWRELRACLGASMPAPIGYYRALAQPVGEAARRMKEAAARPAIETPVLHLQGSDDGCIAASAGRGQERFFAGDFESEVMDGLGHFMQLEDPDRVASRILDWLR